MTDVDGVRGYQVVLRPIDAVANVRLTLDGGLPVSRTPPRGEIRDVLAAEYPEWISTCDPAFHDIRVGSVTIREPLDRESVRQSTWVKVTVTRHWEANADGLASFAIVLIGRKKGLAPPFAASCSCGGFGRLFLSLSRIFALL